MVNPEIDNYVEPESEKPKICKDCGNEIVNGICCSFIEPESEQQLTHYYKIIVTLKSGVQIEICSRKSYDELPYDALDGSLVIDGFIKTPLLVEKTIKIVREEVVAIEIIKDPCIAQVIPWPKDEHLGIDGQPINIPSVSHCDDGFGPLEERDKVEKPLSTHDADLSEIDGAGQDRTKQDDSEGIGSASLRK